MLNSGIMPPSAVKLSCIALTAPQEAAVVMTENRALAAIPKRTSLPSILPPVVPSAWRTGLPAAYCQYVTVTPATNSTSIAARIAQPCRLLPTALPKHQVRPKQIMKIDSI